MGTDEESVSNLDAETVILVVSDSLRADTAINHLPYLQTLADQHTVFTDFHAPGASTPSSMPGIMQSRSPLDHRGYGLSLPPDTPTLAENLSRAGVQCGGWHSNVYTGANYGFDRGFDSFADLLHGTSEQQASTGQTTRTWRDVGRTLTERLGVSAVAEQVFEQIKRHGIAEANPKVRAEAVIDTCLQWIPNRPDGQQRFAWLQLMDTHLPYFPPQRYREQVSSAPTRTKDVYDLWKRLIEEPELLTEREIEKLQGLYIAEGKYVDDQLQRLVDELKERQLWSDAIVIFTADHGELFADRDVPGGVNLKHPDYLCEELTHVPLVVAGEQISDRTVSKIGSGVDIAPTVSQFFEISSPEEWIGLTLNSEEYYERDRIVSALSHAYGDGTGTRIERDETHVAVRSSERAVLWWIDDNKPTEYYRRTSDGEVRIPDDEIGDQFETELEIATECANRYTAVSNEGDEGGDITKRLRDLGYVE